MKFGFIADEMLPKLPLPDAALGPRALCERHGVDPVLAALRQNGS